MRVGGNCSGIPTPQGNIHFDDRFAGKPLVFCGTVGLIPKKINKKLSHIKKANHNDLIIMVGGRVGKDGIHGATFSSEELDPIKRSKEWIGGFSEYLNEVTTAGAANHVSLLSECEDFLTMGYEELVDILQQDPTVLNFLKRKIYLNKFFFAFL